jgi:hypothetical protein
MQPQKKLWASTSRIWTNCPGSTVLTVLKPTNTLLINEGILCHLLVYLIANGSIHFHDTVSMINDNPDFIAKNKTGLFMTQEYKELAFEAVQYRNKINKAPFQKSITGVLTSELWEQRIDGGSILPGVKGTLDYMFYQTNLDVLHIVDFKFGYTPIQAVKNTQLLIYSVGAMRHFSTPVTEIHLHIFQPRDYINSTEKVWKLDYKEWLNEIESLSQAVHVAQSGTPTRTGPHCQYCLSRLVCKAFLNSVSCILDSIQINPEDIDLSAEALGKELEYIKRMETFIVSARKSLEDYITFKIESGYPIPGWMIDSTPKRRKWNPNIAISEIKEIERMLGITLTFEKLISITEAKRFDSAFHPIIDSLITIGKGSKKLIPFDNTKIKEIFNGNR